MHRLLTAATVLALVGSASLALAAEPAESGVETAVHMPIHMLRLDVRGRIEVGPDGHVLGHHLDDSVASVVRERVASNMAQWQFEPILVDGKPVAASTDLLVSVEAIPTSTETYQLVLHHVWFGEFRGVEKAKPPRYPVDALRIGLGAEVIVILKLAADGKVMDAYARQTNLSLPGPEEMAMIWRKRFEDASIAAVKKWRFKPGAMINGESIGSELEVPVHFTIANDVSETDKKGWALFVPGPINPSPWGNDNQRVCQTNCVTEFPSQRGQWHALFAEHQLEAL